MACVNSLKKITLLVFIACLTLPGCAGTDTAMFEQALSQTGLVTGNQASALFKFGGSVASGVKGFSAEEEYYLGRAVSAKVLSKYQTYSKQPLTSYANKIAATLIRVSDKPETFNGYRVAILNTPEINAVSAPGGFIFISRGFINLLPDEDAFAAVIAHEIAHVVKEHGIKSISESNISSAFLALGKEAAQAQNSTIVGTLTNAFGDSVTDITNTLIEKGYSRNQEYDADEYALTLLSRAGYNPGALKKALEALVRAKNSTKNDGGWMSTHPEPADRIDELGSSDEQIDSAGISLRASRFEKLAKAK